jgi:hypothetical protein
MQKYDLSNPEDLGRLAKLIGGLVGPEASFVFAFVLNREKGGSGAISNVDPDSSAKILASAGLQFINDPDFESVTLRDN